QCLELRSEGLVLTAGLRQPPQFLEHSVPLHLTTATDFLKRLHTRQESRKLIVAQLQFLLRLHHDICVEEALNFGGRDTVFHHRAGRRAASTRTHLCRKRRRGGGQREDAQHHRDEQLLSSHGKKRLTRLCA